MRSQIELARCLLAAKKAGAAPMSDDFISAMGKFGAIGMAVGIAWVLGCAEDPPGYSETSEADAFAYLEKVKEEWSKRANPA